MPTQLSPSIRYLLLQVRNAGDPQRAAEAASFARELGCDVAAIGVHDLLSGPPPAGSHRSADVVLLGGSGDYSVVGDAPFLPAALDLLRALHDTAKPTFASCWGFQAMARALGGTVVHDRSRAELGTHPAQLTAAGLADPVFGPLGGEFAAQMGHEDCVDALPEGAVLLASTAKVTNQAYTFPGRPIYCTQFHPELSHADMCSRVRQYPSYLQKIAGIPFDRFDEICRDTPETGKLLPRFVKHVLG